MRIISWSYTMVISHTGVILTTPIIPTRLSPVVTHLSDVELIDVTRLVGDVMATTSQVNANNPKEKIVAIYLREQVQTGKCYFKSRFIADDLELSSNEIGAVMRKLKQQSDRLEIEKWSYTNGTTWRVTANETAATRQEVG
jgi:hypothetical protein